ncbi:hypothetical protein DCAR_0414685 [Daucus carota subsp. sativus]|uniref:Uncharacterized protein n=1 Tax=Daucus carota subsp. sativus TaxID=79200 RepID=A0A164ZYN6_DAUCS|nr:hypothetical protein DCAR_0414685 [Daucus carota subsp. sativus]
MKLFLFPDGEDRPFPRQRNALTGARRLEQLFDKADDMSVDQHSAHHRHYACDDPWEGYMNLGSPSGRCIKCGSSMWKEERNKSRKNSQPTYSLCCRDGMVSLPLEIQFNSLSSDGSNVPFYSV